jgi:hypothetical protein
VHALLLSRPLWPRARRLGETTVPYHEDHKRRAETSHSRISIHTADEQHEQVRKNEIRFAARDFDTSPFFPRHRAYSRNSTELLMEKYFVTHRRHPGRALAGAIPDMSTN